MTLRVRLTLYFSIIVVLPLAVAAISAGLVLVRDLERNADRQMGLALEAVSQQVRLLRLRAGDLSEDLAAPERDLGRALAARDRDALTAAVAGVSGRQGRADVVVVAAPAGELLAAQLSEPGLPSGVPAPTPETLAIAAGQGRVRPHLVGQVRPVLDPAGRKLGAVLVGRWVDQRLAEQLAGNLQIDLTLFIRGRPVASTGPDLTAMTGSEAPEERVAAADESALVRGVDFNGWTAVASRSRGPIARARTGITLAMLGVLATAAVAAALLGWLLSQLVVRPVRELAEAARDVAAGDLERRIAVRGGDELAMLGAAFNTMTANLRQQVGELELSRDALQRSLDRLGQTLSSTLDLNRTLAAVVDAATTALTAERAALYMLAAGRTWLYVKVARGLAQDHVDKRIGVGQGLVGWVAQTGSSVRLPQDAATVPALGPDEPTATTLVAVPLFSPTAGQVIGVMVLYNRSDGVPFGASDLQTLRSFAVQASVAIENVRLHEATQQASITDSLTGLWNLRYFQQRAEEEVERAIRFGHTLSLIILDIDHFKQVNDRYGHLVGDQVLVEVAHRVAAQVREVDTVARYGGEELVLVLPETDPEGARSTAERIREAVAATPIRAHEIPDGQGEELAITVSLGVASFPLHGRTATELLREADWAMYAAKEAGRNRVVVADADAAVG